MLGDADCHSQSIPTNLNNNLALNNCPLQNVSTLLIVRIQNICKNKWIKLLWVFLEKERREILNNKCGERDIGEKKNPSEER